ncbi:hypothetical protein SAMN05421724_0433 [Pseudomonas syringae]|nr:hypothetical protein SAMN05421724_0433 [Pseudomonas syringae]
MKLSIVIVFLLLVAICFLEGGQQYASQTLSQIGAGGLMATFLAIMVSAFTS